MVIEDDQQRCSGDKGIYPINFPLKYQNCGFLQLLDKRSGRDTPRQGIRMGPYDVGLLPQRHNYMGLRTKTVFRRARKSWKQIALFVAVLALVA